METEEGGILDTDSEDELPSGWEQQITEQGLVYYVCHSTRSTQWQHPVTGGRKAVAKEMPYGWTTETDDDGNVYYLNILTQKKSRTDPRLAFPIELSADGILSRSTSKKIGPLKSVEIRQRFDASSTALQVLRGSDLTNQYVIITGGTSGIGYETARSLAMHGAHVVIACRDVSKGREVCKMIEQSRNVKKETGNIQPLRVKPLYCDLAKLSTVRQFAEEYRKLNVPLTILILNAGVFALPYTLTEDGLEETFQTNHLSHFYLTLLLQDILIASGPARVIFITSESHRFTDVNSSTISHSLLSPPPGGYRALFAYNASKMCNVLHCMLLHHRLSEHGVGCFAVHPGNVVCTGLTRHWWPYRLLFTLLRPFSKSKQQAAATTVYCATASELACTSGYYFNNCFKCLPSEEALNPKTAQLLWDISEFMLATRGFLPLISTSSCNMPRGKSLGQSEGSRLEVHPAGGDKGLVTPSGGNDEIKWNRPESRTDDWEVV